MSDLTTSPREAAPAPGLDPFLYDLDMLREIAPEGVIARALAYDAENRVMSVERHGDEVRALVEGSKPDNPYAVTIHLDREGSLVTQCTCPYDGGLTCKHAVATLTAYYKANGVKNVAVTNASEEAIAERIRRGRSEIKVTHVSGLPHFGTWTAQSLKGDPRYIQSYRVQIRSLTERSNHCLCPDFATNTLGTCKHIEAVLHRLRRDLKKRGEDTHAAPPVSVIYLAWDSLPAPQIRVRRGASVPAQVAGIFNKAFNQRGHLDGVLPQAFFALQRQLEGYEDHVTIGDEVIDHVRRLAESAIKREDARSIREEIVRFGQQLPGVNARLFPYQVEGVAFLAATGRALLADDMGLGKTLQAIAAAVWLQQKARLQRVLIVCPASLKGQWAREIERFSGCSAVVIQGPPASRLVQYRRDTTFVIMNYELVMADFSIINQEVRPDLLILDEAQRIRNWRTKTATAIKRIESPYAFVLTGTPLENRLEDLYSVLQVVDPRILGPLWRVNLDYTILDENGRVRGYKNLNALRQRIAPVMLRRNRDLVKEQLPKRTDLQLDVVLTARQGEIHASALRNAAILAETMGRRPLSPSEEKRFLSLLQTARMACNAAGLVDKESKGSPKLEELERLLVELCVERGRKVVVFSQWARMTEMAEEVAEGLGLGTVRLYGGVPTQKRDALIKRFTTDPKVQVFLSTDAGGVGLNLQAASVLINLDMHYNPAVLEQRIGRIHRLGQKEPIQVIRLMAADSYEVEVARIAAGKRDLFGATISGDSTEDVVGISKRDLEVFLDALKTATERSSESSAVAVADDPPAPPPPSESGPRVTEDKGVPTEDSEAEAMANRALHQTISRAQQLLGEALEQVLAVPGGLLLVVKDLTETLEAAIESLDTESTLNAIDTRAYHVLKRLGAPAIDFPALPLAAPRRHPLLVKAEDNLTRAEGLAEQGDSALCLQALFRAMLAAVAVRADKAEIPPLTEIPLWVYGEVIPRGLLSPNDVNGLIRAMSLASTPEVPDLLVTQVLQDARRFVAQARQGST